MSVATDFFRAHLRLAISVCFGVATAVLVPGDSRFITRTLIGWDAGVYLYLLLIWILMVRADHRRIRALACLQDETAVVVLALIMTGAVMSLLAIVLELNAASELAVSERALHFTLTGATVVGSWLLVPTVFTLHYGHMFYIVGDDELPLRFPEGEREPDYWDFAYFSFTIAVASQTADVAIFSRAMRKTVLAQAVLSFVFNAAILGFSVNMAAGLVGSK